MYYIVQSTDMQKKGKNLWLIGCLNQNLAPGLGMIM